MSDTARTTVQAPSAVHPEGLWPEVPTQVLLDRPQRPERWDYATNMAIASAKRAGKTPGMRAEAFSRHLRVVGRELDAPEEINRARAADEAEET